MTVSHRVSDGRRVEVEATAAVNGPVVWLVLPDGVVLDGLDWWLRSFRCETPPGELTELETCALAPLRQFCRLLDDAIARYDDPVINRRGWVDPPHTRN